MKTGMKRAAQGATWLACAAALAACTGYAPLPARAVELNAAGAQALAVGDLSTAEARLSVALEYSPRFVEAWVNLGYVELRRGNFVQARRDFVRARSYNYDIPAPHHALGVLAELQRDGPTAEDCYRAALAVDPGFAPARANLARRLFERGQYENAREQFQRLREVAPAAAQGWAGVAEALLQLDREAEAEAVIERARAALGDEPSLVLVYARLQLAAGNWDTAEAALAPLVGGNDRTRRAPAWAWIAVARAARGDAAGARQAVDAALAIASDEPVARRALALIRP